MQAGLRFRPEGQEYIGFARNKGTMSPARATTAVSTAEGAIVFTDLAGFTEFTAIQGDEAALELLGVQDQVVGDLIEGRGSDLVGHDVNVAARVADLAAPGEVLISEAAAERVAERMEGVWFEEMGPTVMK